MQETGNEMSNEMVEITKCEIGWLLRFIGSCAQITDTFDALCFYFVKIFYQWKDINCCIIYAELSDRMTSNSLWSLYLKFWFPKKVFMVIVPQVIRFR